MSDEEREKQKIEEYRSYEGEFCQITVSQAKDSKPFYFKGKILKVDFLLEIDDYKTGTQKHEIRDIRGIRPLTHQEMMLGEQDKRQRELAKLVKA